MQQWDPADPWGGQSPNFTAMKSWGMNAVRLPLNEASWLDYTCTDATGTSYNPDPGGNYKATVESTVAAATAAGMYVILDLHWSAPSTFCPLAQNQMADTDNSVNFWKAIATQFKGYPNVMFELFNEPFVGYGGPVAQASWSLIMQGGPQTNYVTGGTPYQVNYSWTIAGMQEMLNAVRATGATNVVLVGTPSWDEDLSLAPVNEPTDPLQQIAVTWHPYPNGAYGTAQEAYPKLGSIAYTWASAILAAGYPLVITETGDHDTAGTVGSPLLQNLLPWADSNGVSYLGWTWNAWEDPDFVLITDAAGDPTPGYGTYFKQHLTCLAAGGTNCP
jgi:endoglucanase